MKLLCRGSFYIEDMVIGYFECGYPGQRLIIGKTRNEYKKISLLTDMRHFILKIIKGFIRNSSFLTEKGLALQFEFSPLFTQKYDVLHSFNIDCRVSKPWVVSFESRFPCRFDEPGQAYYKKLANRIMKDNCRGLFALSQWSYGKTKDMWERNMDNPSYTECIKKLSVLEPPQEPLMTENDITDKFSEVSCLEFIFVGRDFWRKGGNNLIGILSQYSEKFRFHLNLISDLRISSEPVEAPKLEEEREMMKDFLPKQSWITWHESLPNKEVLELIKKSHVGFLPTYGDTYGFSVLEMQAGGCPVVSTNGLSLQYINDDSMGWMIDIGVGEEYEGDDWIEHKLGISERIDHGLEKILNEIFKMEPKEIREKALAGLTKIKERHSPKRYAEILQKIYEGTNKR